MAGQYKSTCDEPADLAVLRQSEAISDSRYDEAKSEVHLRRLCEVPGRTDSWAPVTPAPATVAAARLDCHGSTRKCTDDLA